MNCIFCKTGVYEPVGEFSDVIHGSIKLNLTKFFNNEDSIRIYICSNPNCNHVHFRGGKKTLYNLRHKFRQNEFEKLTSFKQKQATS